MTHPRAATAGQPDARRIDPRVAGKEPRGGRRIGAEQDNHGIAVARADPAIGASRHAGAALVIGEHREPEVAEEGDEGSIALSRRGAGTMDEHNGGERSIAGRQGRRRG